jgi:medium-chain acyl-[acyl-carrier-protein] hydrolase
VSGLRFTSLGFGPRASSTARAEPVAPRLRLYCFPNAGGSATVYRGLASELRASVDVRAALLPGRDGRFAEPALTSWPELVGAAVAAICEDAPTSFALLGHSMGALLAFEVARELRRLGLLMPELLVASARVAPQLSVEAEPVSHLSDQELAQAMSRQSGGIPSAVLADAEALALFVPALRTDMRLLEHYRYRPEAALAVPLLAFAGERDPLAGLAQVEAWREQTASSFRFRRCAGDHWIIRSHAAELCRELLSALGMAPAATPVEHTTAQAVAAPAFALHDTRGD